MNWDRVLDALVLPFSKWLEMREDVLPEDGVDVIIGFGIGMRADGLPSLLSKGVARRCAELFKAGLTKTIIFTGGTSENNITEARAMKLIALKLGVPEENILTEEFSRNTHQNSVNVLALMRREGFIQNTDVRVATVGQYLHSRRCRSSFRRVAPKGWKVCGKKAYCPYDPECTQRRLSSEWRFFPWEVAWNILFKILRWT